MQSDWHNYFQMINKIQWYVKHAKRHCTLHVSLYCLEERKNRNRKRYESSAINLYGIVKGCDSSIWSAIEKFALRRTHKQSIHIGFGCESNHSVFSSSFRSGVSLIFHFSTIQWFNNSNVTDVANGHGKKSQAIVSLVYSFYFHVFYSLFCYVLHPFRFIAHFYLYKINCSVFSANWMRIRHTYLNTYTWRPIWSDGWRRQSSSLQSYFRHCCSVIQTYVWNSITI